MSMDAINNTVRQFITSHFSQARVATLSDEDPLLKNGIVDSLGILDIVSFIESHFGIRVADEELVTEHFGSIRRIAAFIHTKQRETVRT